MTLTKFIFKVLISLFVSGSVYGQFLQHLPVGDPRASALGFAVTADPKGIDSIHYNPAGLAKTNSSYYTLKVVMARLRSKTQFGSHSGETEGFINAFGLEDELENSTSRLNWEEPVLALPGGGIQKVPALAFPLGGILIKPPGANYVIATNVYSPQAVGYSRSEDDPGRYQGKEVSILRINYFSPSIAAQISDNWYVGASMGFSTQTVGMNMDLRAPNLLLAAVEAGCDAVYESVAIDSCSPSNRLGPFNDVGNLTLEVEQLFSPTFNIGLLWEPIPWFSAGLTYRSGTTVEAKGPYEFSYDPSWQGFWRNLNVADIPFLPNGAQSSERGEATLEMAFPQEFQGGVKLVLFPSITLTLDARWTEYSAWDSFDITFDKNLDFLKVASLLAPNETSATQLKLPRNYKDTYAYSIGFQYQWNDNLELWAGYEYREAMADKDKQDLIIPLGPADYFGVGFGVDIDNNTKYGLAISYLKAYVSVASGQSNNANSTDIDNLIYNPYAGLPFTNTTDVLFFNFSYQENF